MTYLACLAERTEDKINGYSLVHTKAELDVVVADNSSANTVIIRSDFASEYFTPSGLGRFISNARRVNRNILIELDHDSNVLTIDKFLKKLTSCRNMDEVLMLAVKYEKEFMDTIRTLNKGQEDASRELLAASSSVARLQAIIDDKNKTIEDMDYALKLERENKFQVSSRLNSIVARINNRFGVGIDESKLFKIDGNSYDKVIYIKELTRIQYIDSFIYYLKEILKVLYSMPTRLLVIEGYYASGKVSQYDLPPHYALKERDVISGDILMLGMQPKLMEDVLKNPSKISILVVLDRAGYAVPHISGNNVELFYTASDIKDVPADVPAARVISYKEDNLFIPYIKGFDKLTASERISRYSSMGIVKKIVELLERR